MIRELFSTLRLWLAPPMPPMPSPPISPAALPSHDGRIFVWVRSRGGSRSPVHAMVLRDPSIGPRLPILAKEELSPAEYDDDLTTLMERYPAPALEPSTSTPWIVLPER